MQKIISILSKTINEKMKQGNFKNDFAGILDNSQPGKFIILTTMEETPMLSGPGRRGAYRNGCNC